MAADSGDVDQQSGSTAAMAYPRNTTTPNGTTPNGGPWASFLRGGRRPYYLRLASAAVVMLAGMHTAQAADQAPPRDSATLEEVLVTAQKVSEDVRKVPESISVLSGVQIEARHFTEIADLTRSIPNLSFSSQGGPGNQNIELRGVSSTAGSSTVSVYLDEVPMTVRNLDTQGQAEPSFFDVQRVEVLRGPQGTLYGASSMGGTIRYISNPVDLAALGGSVYSDVSGTKHGGVNYSERGVLNIPLIDHELGIRIGISTTHDSGYIDHYSPDTGQLLQRGVNGNAETAARVVMEWQPVPTLSIKPALIYQYNRTDDLNVVDIGLPDLLSQQKRVQEGGKETLAVPSVTIVDNFDWGNLTSVTSYFYRRFVRTVDGTAYNSGFLGSVYLDGAVPPITGLDGQSDGYLVGNVASPVHYTVSTKQISQEVRVSSKPFAAGGNPFTWIAGAFYSHQKLDSLDYEDAPGIDNVIATVYGTAVQNAVFGGSFPNDFLYLQHKLYTEQQYAPFGELTYNFSSALRLTAGFRYIKSRISLTRVGDGFINNGFAASSPVTSGATIDGSATTPKMALAYDVDEDTTTYLTISKGTRLGGPNRPVPVTVCGSDLAAIGLTAAPAGYGADSLWNYEGGAKSRLMDGRLSLTGDVFYINWKNIQVDLNLPTCGFDFNTNVGSGKSYGSEAEIKFKPVNAWTLGLAGGYTHATLTSDQPSLNIQNGDPIPGAPKWTADASAQYDLHFTDSLKGFASADWNWVGSSHGALLKTDPDYDRPTYSLLGLNAGVDFDAWEFAVFAKNVLNDQKIIQRPNLQSVNRGYTLTPRTIGISAAFKF
jgi:iron complex outermembrane receptor protein